MGRTKRVLLREIELRRGAVLCPGCDASVEPRLLTKHHIRPRSQGGPTTIENLVLICRPCHDEVHRAPRGHVRARVKTFLQERAAPDAFPPPPEPVGAEEAISLFLRRCSMQILRAGARRRFAINPPFDPFWPVARSVPHGREARVRFTDTGVASA